MSDDPAENTDREIWREKPGDYYSPSIHVTRDGGIGIDVGGHVFVLDVYGWHRLAIESHQRDMKKLPIGGGLEQGGISDRLSNFDEYGDRIRDRS